MKWLLVVAVALLAVVGLVAAAGAMLPRAHVARRSLRLRHAAPSDLWAVVADLASAPSWRHDVKKTDRVADRNGHAVWIEHGAKGPITFEILEAVPPRRLVTEIVDSSMFGGTWTYEIAPETEATVLTITEAGWVQNPIFRIVAKYGFGHHATIDAYLKSVATRFGEHAELSGE